MNQQQFNWDQLMIYIGVIKAGAIGLIGVILYSQIKQLRKVLSDQKIIKKTPIKELEQFEDIISRKETSNLHLLKLTPFYFQVRYKKIDIHTAQRYKFQPNDRKVVLELQNKLSSRINSELNKKRSPALWFAKMQHPRLPNSTNYQRIEGFGTIKGDFFDIKSKCNFEENKKLGYWKQFTNWIFQKFYKASNSVKQAQPFAYFLGPVIGILKYDINLMKDIKIIAVCNFQNGKIIPAVTATSKSEILNYYQSLIHEKYITVGALMVGAIFLSRWLWSDIKKSINAMKVRNNQINNKYYKMDNPMEEKMCIICYGNSRNMIFFDCRHMIMCNQCTENYDSDVCPYCKMEIDDIKPVIGI